MRPNVPTLVLLGLALSAGPALAWDPDAHELEPGMTDPDPMPYVVPEGIYLVTDVYAGDAVTTDGPTTTYSTVTVQDTPGTYARVLEMVGTGAASGFDGASFNGRGALPDGRSVAGTYYEDFVLTPRGFVSVNVVFFQDDSLTRAGSTTTPPTTSPTAPPVTEASPAARTTTAPGMTSSGPTDGPNASRQATSRVVEREREDSTPKQVNAVAAVALAENGPVLGSIEVLRGRTVRLWPRAFVDGVPVPVRAWRMTSGDVERMSSSTGTGSEPCVVSWLTLPAAGSAFAIRFEVSTDAAPGRLLPALLTVAVRSPALLQ
jgi:hypothetical protein